MFKTLLWDTWLLQRFSYFIWLSTQVDQANGLLSHLQLMFFCGQDSQTLFMVVLYFSWGMAKRPKAGWSVRSCVSSYRMAFMWGKDWNSRMDKTIHQSVGAYLGSSEQSLHHLTDLGCEKSTCYHMHGSFWTPKEHKKWSLHTRSCQESKMPLTWPIPPVPLWLTIVYI